MGMKQEGHLQRLARRRRRTVRIDVAALVYGAVGACVQLYRGHDWIALIHVVSFLSFAFMILDDLAQAAKADRLVAIQEQLHAKIDAMKAEYGDKWLVDVVDTTATEVRGRHADIVLVDDMGLADGRPAPRGRW